MIPEATKRSALRVLVGSCLTMTPQCLAVNTQTDTQSWRHVLHKDGIVKDSQHVCVRVCVCVNLCMCMFMNVPMSLKSDNGFFREKEKI